MRARGGGDWRSPVWNPGVRPLGWKERLLGWQHRDVVMRIYTHPPTQEAASATARFALPVEDRGLAIWADCQQVYKHGR